MPRRNRHAHTHGFANLPPQKQPQAPAAPPRPPAPPKEFHLAWSTRNYLRVESEEHMISQLPFDDFDVALGDNKQQTKGKAKSGPSRPAAAAAAAAANAAAMSAGERALLNVVVEEPERLAAALLPVKEDALRDGAEHSRVFLCGCDAPFLFVTHDEWLAHRETAAHKRCVRAVTSARLQAEFEQHIYAEAEQFAASWDAHANPLIATGRCYFNFGCAEHSAAGDFCPSWTSMVEALSDAQFNDPVTREPIRLARAQREYGFHGCRGSKALGAIICQSLDPARRTAQAYGAGEYSGKSAAYSVSFSADSDRMFVVMNLRWSGLSNQNSGQFWVNNQPLDNRPGHARVRFVIPVIVCMFVSQKMLAEIGQMAGPVAALRHNTPQHAAAAAQMDDTRLLQRRKRIEREMQLLRERCSVDGVFARPRASSQHLLNHNVYIVDFVLELGPGPDPAHPDDLNGLELCGTLQLPAAYPFAPPTAVLLTPNGRIRAFVDVCLGFDAHSWSPSTTISSMLLGLVSILTSPNGEFDAAASDPATIRSLARNSRAANARMGGFVLELRRQLTEAKEASRRVMAEAEAKRVEEVIRSLRGFA